MHLDKNGNQLHVGDLVLYGDRHGTVLILEDWSKHSSPSLPDSWQTVAGVYVSDIGQWGDARAVPASHVVRVPVGVTVEQARRYPAGRAA